MKINKISIKIAAIICIFTLILSVFSACGVKSQKRDSTAFGSTLSAEIYTEEQAAADELFDIITRTVATAQNELSCDSEDGGIFILNRDKLLYASDALKSDLGDAILVATILGDRVDISTGRAYALWGFGTDSPGVPDSEELKKAAADKSMDKIYIAGNSNKITIAPEIEIDMSAFREGIACDRAYEETKLLEIPYTLTIGDTFMAYGRHPSTDKWTVEITNPLSDKGEALAEISVEIKTPACTIFVSTSGIHENSFTENGVTYHSKLDPKTGYPVESQLASVTVVASSGINANALSDAVFVNGFKESSLTYLENFGAQAIFVFKDNTYYVTEGLKEDFRLTDSSFTEHTGELEFEGFIE